VLAELARSDILGCRKPVSAAQPGVLPTLLASQDAAVTYELVRLISALASDSMGREYLLQPGSSVVDEVYAVLLKTPEQVVKKQGGACLGLQEH
jgi:hypothetical protein